MKEKRHEGDRTNKGQKSERQKRKQVENKYYNQNAIATSSNEVRTDIVTATI
jgi:hypothetical protein